MANSKTSMFLNLALVLALLLTISLAEGHRTFGSKKSTIKHQLSKSKFGFLKAQSTPICDSVTGVKSGDTCSAIAQQFGLTTDFFDSINPNLNCDALFVGQWLCVSGSA